MFEFEGVEQTIECVVAVEESQGTASATFTAPATPGTYVGIAYAIQPDALRRFRRPSAESLTLGGGRVAQADGCGERYACDEFTVIVQAPTTTAAPTTTLAPTTLAPTTTDAAAVPPAPTTVSTVPPVTGPSRNDNTVTIALLLVVVGGGLIVATRRRGSRNET